MAAGMFFLKMENCFYCVCLPGRQHELEKNVWARSKNPLLLKQTANENCFAMRRFYAFMNRWIASSYIVGKDLIEKQANPTLASYAGKLKCSLR